MELEELSVEELAYMPPGPRLVVVNPAEDSEEVASVIPTVVVTSTEPVVPE